MIIRRKRIAGLQSQSLLCRDLLVYLYAGNFRSQGISMNIHSNLNRWVGAQKVWQAFVSGRTREAKRMLMQVARTSGEG
ncbi:hypothetical protein RP75_02250 [Agrobacterium arsenijevicii]|uniref:Transposase n=1 Tax=Agrobacterium arsenijevicii TaxID=1585697 RepID=A0ABR5DCK5_9HYPH|nr:hypothetical protein RP75_02250 [Agrobacterium arsenijevicii]